MLHFELDVDKVDYLLDLLEDIAENLDEVEFSRIVSDLREQADSQ